MISAFGKSAVVMAERNVRHGLRADAERRQRIEDQGARRHEARVGDDQGVPVANERHAASHARAFLTDVARMDEMNGCHGPMLARRRASDRATLRASGLPGRPPGRCATVA